MRGCLCSSDEEGRGSEASFESVGVVDIVVGTSEDGGGIDGEIRKRGKGFRWSGGNEPRRGVCSA